MNTPRGITTVVALAIAVLITLSAAQQALAAPGTVIPLQSELKVGSYVNMSFSSVSQSASRLASFPLNYTGYENETVTYVNSSSYNIRNHLVESSTPSSFNVNSTGNFTPEDTPFPYFNNTNLYYPGGSYTSSGTYKFSNGTYDFNGHLVPMEKVVIRNWSVLNSTMPLSILEFDSYSGILLNFSYETIQNSSPGNTSAVYTNGTTILTATNLTMVSSAHGSTGEYSLAAAIIVIVALVAVVGIFTVRNRKRIR